MTSISATQIDFNNFNPINLIPGNTVSLLGTVGAVNFDSYNIILNEPQSLDVSLFNITTSADLVITDSNGNPVPGNGASQPLSTPENFIVPLNPGSYQVQVFQPFNDLSLGDSNYQLDIVSIGTNNPPIQPPINQPGNLIDNSNDNPNTPTILGNLVPQLPINRLGTINDFDGVDFYSVSVQQPLSAGIALQNLTGNIDVAVLDPNGNLIASGENLGASDEAFQAVFSNPGEYLIDVYQTAPGINTDYNLGIFPGNIINIEPSPPPPPPASISIDDIVDNSDEAVRNREDTAFIFKQDYLLNATPNTPLTIDLIGNNIGFDPLLEVYQLPKDSLLEVNRQVIPIAASDNGGSDVNDVDARIGPGVSPDITVPSLDDSLIVVPAELNLSSDFDYLLRVTYTELPSIPIGGYTLSASVPNGFVSLTQVELGRAVGEPIIGGDPTIGENFF